MSTVTPNSAVTGSTGTPVPRVRFFHRNGRYNVGPELDILIKEATKSFRAAVCYSNEAGNVFLSRHSSRLKLKDSYFVASVDHPTDLQSLKKLHHLAPDHVYIHLGGTTPEERGVGRSLMHSKVLLGESDEECRLWVGSHNLTARALGGGNFEAGLLIADHKSSQVISDAIGHLESCRDTAEPFNPADMDRYVEIQNRRRRELEWDTERLVIVIHAEMADPLPQKSFITHIQLEPLLFDNYFAMDRSTRLYLHPPGTLKIGKSVDYGKTVLWTGEITAIVRTGRHPKNRGASGRFPDAEYGINLPDPPTIPVMVTAGQTSFQARTQVVVRLAERIEPGSEVYTVDKRSPIENMLVSAPALEMHEVDADMLKFFTPESVVGKTLQYRPTTGIRQELTVTGYEETLISVRSESFYSPKMPDAVDRVHYTTRIPKNPIDPFFFLSSYVIRPKRPK